MNPVAGSLLLVTAFAALAAAVQAERRGNVSLLIGVAPPPRSPSVAEVPRSIARGARGRLVSLAAFAGGTFLGLVIAGFPGGLAGALAGAAIPRTIRRRRARRSDEAFETQLATSVSGIAAALRAGLSLSQAIQYSARESAAPLQAALEEIVDKEALGVPLDDSLAQWSAARRSPDARLVASVLRLRVGAGLPTVLDQVARTLRERETSRREVRSLTAQARLSGAILGSLPIGFFLFLSAMSRHDMSLAYRSPIGLTAIVAGLGLEAGAYLWIRKLLRVPA